MSSISAGNHSSEDLAGPTTIHCFKKYIPEKTLQDLVNLHLFSMKFYQDLNSNEYKWVMFQEGTRGAIGKIIFEIDHIKHSAHISSIHVAKKWRGKSLSVILFRYCLQTLQEKYVNILFLEAEEDQYRHGKLVYLYSSWGFIQNKQEKIAYLYNNNQTFRKIPMNLPIDKSKIFSVFRDSPNQFGILKLLSIRGKSLIAHENGTIKASKDTGGTSFWQVLFAKSDTIYLRSYYGKFMCADSSGALVADRACNSTWETFLVAPYKEGITVRTFHGSYLGIDLDGSIILSGSPCLWKSHGENLVANIIALDTYYLKLMRMNQTIHFVKAMHEKLGHFKQSILTVEQCLKGITEIDGSSSPEESGIIKRMIYVANSIRKDGHPDWMQLAGFLHCMGLLLLNAIKKIEPNCFLLEIPYQEWLNGEQESWILGHGIPQYICHPELNESDSFSSDMDRSIYHPNCGLKNVMLTWTPDEYLYHVLLHNHCSMPSIGFYLIRFRSCKVWYQYQAYEELMDEEDTKMRPWVTLFSKYLNPRPDDIYEEHVDESLDYYTKLSRKYLPEYIEW